MSVSSNKVRGARILQEIESQKCSLEYILTTLRSKCLSNHNVPGLPSNLFALSRTQSLKGSLAIKCNPTTAAATALINHILTYQLTTYRGTVALLDFTGRFSVTHLKSQCETESLNHLYVFQPPNQTKEVFEAVKQWMLYGEHESHDKEWVGTIIIGADRIGEWNGLEKVLVSCGWNGWMNVARDEPRLYPEGISVEEAWITNSESSKPVSWKAWCDEGEYRWS